MNFDGVNLLYGGEMTGAEMTAQMQTPYSPNLIYRNSNWIWHAGTPVHLLRDPNGTVWVMQEYTKDVDPSLTLDNLHQVGSKLKNLPKGWVFETKVLTQGAVAQHRPGATAGRPSFATSCTAPTRAAATARIPVPTTCRNPRLTLQNQQ